jgi:apolipoprotein N-acyltransferase
MYFVKNNATKITPMLYCLTSLFFGAAAGINISLPLSSLMTLCSLAVLFSLLGKCRSQLQEGVLVFFWAFGFVASSTYWITIAIYDPVRTPPSTAWMIAGFVFFIHACIYTLTYLTVRFVIGYVLLRLEKSRAPHKMTVAPVAISLPLSLGIAEVVRTCGFWAMPWGMIGYSQLANPVMIGLYPVIGVYGVAVITCTFSVVLVYGITSIQKYLNRIGNRSWSGYIKTNFAKFSYLTAILTILFLSQFIQWTTASETPIRARVVHTHMPNIEKYDLQVQKLAQERMVTLSKLKDADLTFYPELYMVQPGYAIDKQLRQAIVESVVVTKNTQIFGSPSDLVDVDGRVIGVHNAMIEIDTLGKTKRYAKEVLVPFSEYMPDHPVLSWAMPYILKFPLSNFISGVSTNTDSFIVNNISMAASLCNESAYPFNVHARSIDKNMLINAASDSWIPNKMYERHSWQIVKARALEAQKPLLRSNNTGYSGFIDAWGNEHQMEYGVESDVIFNIYPRYGNTPFTRLALFFSKL